MSFALSSAPVTSRDLQVQLLDQAAGACVTFEGWVRVRNEGREVTALEYEAYEVLALKEGDAVLAEARGRFQVLQVACVHRVGRLALGDLAVWVGVTAEHRGAAFDACRYVIDEIKARVPIWKKEHYVGGETTWINAASRGVYADGSAKKP
jgi:molybdopterin synthase catalytic subunit